MDLQSNFKHFNYRIFDENERLIEEGNILNTQRNDIWKFYDDNGNYKEVRYYHGVVCIRYKDNQNEGK